LSSTAVPLALAQLLIEIAPGIKRAAIMFNPDTAPGGGSYFLPAFEAAAQSLKVASIIAPVHTDAEFETAAALTEPDEVLELDVEF
jgi:putative ABC transport system substrate-binding protein